LVVQIDVRIQTSKRTGNLVYDLINELIEVKDGADFLSGLLQLEEILHLIQIKRGRVRGRRCCEVWTGCHRVSAPNTELIARDVFSMVRTLFSQT
jgi:hypothetical protein